MRILRIVAALATVTALLVPAQAGASSDATPEPEPEPRITLPSFNESAGCDGAQGTRGPYASVSGRLGDWEPILGPWGDVFGRTIGEVRDRLVPVTLPMMDWQRTLYVHQAALPSFQQVLANLEREILAGNWYTIRGSYTWSFHAATIPPGRHLSFHAVGASIDINSHRNPYRSDNVLVTDMPAWFVKAWTDAGWCWGGDWQSIKDPMHFSWQGPLADGSDPAPIRPRSTVSDFSTTTVDHAAWIPSSGEATPLIADVDRDGAPDAVRVWRSTADGRFFLEAAVSHHDFETCTTFDVSEGPPPEGTPVLADFNADGRPDLWSFDTSGPKVKIDAWTLVSNYRDHYGTTTNIPTDGVTALLPTDFDRNGTTDLVVIRAGSPTVVEAWSGPDFASRVSRTETALATDDTWRFALGDRDDDGYADIYFLPEGSPATLSIATRDTGFSVVEQRSITVPASSAFTVNDLDGDGRDDVMFLDEAGRLTALHGGRRTDGLGTASWYSGSWDRHWITGDGCTTGARLGDVDISDDGRFVAFVSNDDSVVPGDTNAAGDVIVLDRTTGDLEIVSRNSSEELANGDRCGRWCSREPSISADGRYVAFTSDADNLVDGDDNAASDVFLHDRATRQTTRVSQPTSGAGTVCDSAHPCRPNSSSPSISDDGRIVAFVSWATNLVPGDTNGSLHPHLGVDVFVRDTIQSTTSRASVRTGGGQANGPSRGAELSGNGRYVLFRSSAPNLTGANWFLRDLATGTTSAISGVEREPSISDDGSRIVFSARSDLTPGSSPGFDVYLREVGSGATSILSERAGVVCSQPACDAWAPAISGDGSHVTFSIAGGELVFADLVTGATTIVSDGPEVTARSAMEDAGHVIVGVGLTSGTHDVDGISVIEPSGAVPVVGLVEPSQGRWHVWSPDGFEQEFFYGNPGDLPFLGDWDCDGVATPGLYRQSDGYVYLRNSNNQGVADIRFYFGNPGDIPLAGDFDGDGCDSVSLFRPSVHRFFIINELGSDDTGLGAADFVFTFGNPGDTPFVGDFDGDGIDEIGLHRRTTGFVYLRNTLTAGVADASFFYGDPGDWFVTGDWNGDGTDTVGLFRPGDATFYLRYENSAGPADLGWRRGSGSWLPFSGLVTIG